MARSALVPQAVVDEGLQPVYTAADALGSTIPGDGDVILHVINADASPTTVTITTGGTLLGEAVADKAVVIPAGEDRLIGRFPASLYNQASGDDAGLVYIDYSNVTSVTVAALAV